MSYLDVSGLRFARGGFELSLSLELAQASTGVILGPSGCGKTTLLRCIAGLENYEEGSISVGGRAIDGLLPEKRNIGFVFQDLALFDHLSGRENIAFGLKLKKLPAAETALKIERLAHALKISPLLDRKPFSMSGGEKQRLAFARAISPQPGLLLMDEPLSSLDAPLRRELRAYLRSTLSSEGITALHVTHDVEEALELGDTLFIMKDGKILARGGPQEVYRNPPDAWCVRFLGLGLLFPVLNAEVKGDACIADTPYGRFACSPSSCPCGEAGGPGESSSETDSVADAEAGGALPPPGRKNAWFFIPRRSLRLVSRSSASGIPMQIADIAGPAAGRDLVGAEVKDIVFQGAYRRIALSLFPSEKAGAQSGSASLGTEPGGENVFEIELGLEPPLSKGEKILLAPEPGQCRILPS